MSESLKFTAGRNIAMRVQPHAHEATVRFHRDVPGFRELPEHRPSVVFESGGNNLWIDRVPGLSQAETWLEVHASDRAAEEEHLAAAGVVGTSSPDLGSATPAAWARLTPESTTMLRPPGGRRRRVSDSSMQRRDRDMRMAGQAWLTEPGSTPRSRRRPCRSPRTYCLFCSCRSPPLWKKNLSLRQVTGCRRVCRPPCAGLGRGFIPPLGIRTDTLRQWAAESSRQRSNRASTPPMLPSVPAAPFRYSQAGSAARHERAGCSLSLRSLRRAATPDRTRLAGFVPSPVSP